MRFDKLAQSEIALGISEIFENKYLNIKGRPILKGMIISTQDITKAKEMELANLTAMLEGQEAERQRLAKEIHDRIGPLMSTIKLNVDGIKSDLKDTTPEVNKKIASMEE